MPATTTSPRRRDAILGAALRAFTERGFTAATVDDVRRLSGASVGSIYHHFDGGKEGLAAALYVDGLRDYQRGYLATLRRHPGAEEGVRALVRHHLRWVAANRDLAAFIFDRREPEVLGAAQEALREPNRVVLAATADWLRPHVADGLVRELPHDLLYMILIGPSQEFARHWLRGRTRSGLARAERVLGDAAWAALAAGGAKP